jgi:hypothetical protein
MESLYFHHWIKDGKSRCSKVTLIWSIKHIKTKHKSDKRNTHHIVDFDWLLHFHLLFYIHFKILRLDHKRICCKEFKGVRRGPQTRWISIHNG